uniref:Ferritin n=1 Tax=Sus scrofa TaxID=9823 RepID=A0A8D1FZ10_PIG
ATTHLSEWPTSKIATAATTQVHQDSEAAIHCQPNLQLCASSVSLSTSYYFDCDDVALKNFAEYVLHQSREEREHAETLMKLQNQRGGRILLQDIWQPERDDWENGNGNPSLLALHTLATAKNDPYLCDFVETPHPEEQVKSIPELGDHVTNLHRMGAPKYGLAEYVVDKHTLGSSES